MGKSEISYMSFLNNVQVTCSKYIFLTCSKKTPKKQNQPPNHLYLQNKIVMEFFTYKKTQIIKEK